MKKYRKTVTIACWWNGRMLMAKRKNTKTFRGYWAFPGGKVDGPGELPGPAATRELLEETGLKIGDYHLTLVDGITGDPTTNVCFIYERHLNNVEVESIRNVEEDKNHDWEWLTPKRALKKKLIPGVARYIKEAVKRGVNEHN